MPRGQTGTPWSSLRTKFLPPLVILAGHKHLARSRVRFCSHNLNLIGSFKFKLLISQELRRTQRDFDVSFVGFQDYVRPCVTHRIHSLDIVDGAAEPDFGDRIVAGTLPAFSALRKNEGRHRCHQRE